MYVLFDACVQVLNSPTNVPTSALLAFKVVNKMTKMKAGRTSFQQEFKNLLFYFHNYSREA